MDLPSFTVHIEQTRQMSKLSAGGKSLFVGQFDSIFEYTNIVQLQGIFEYSNFIHIHWGLYSVAGQRKINI